MKYNSSELPISWFRERYIDGSLTIKPPYQRKPVWKERQKCYLIESILMGLPIPEIYVQQIVEADGKTTFAIVDGQQRMRSILQFLGAETESEELEYNSFPLGKLDANSPWANKRFSDLTAAEKRTFFGHRLAVRYLDTSDDAEIRDLFARLNKYLTPLKPQELRNAIYQGPFIQMITAYADNEYWAENRIVTAEAIRRMGDLEFVSELFIGLLHGPQGGAAEIINDYYAQYEDYEDEFPSQKSVAKLFDSTLKLLQAVLPDIKDRRWSNKTDFYTLFIAIGTLLRTHSFVENRLKSLRTALVDFADDIELLKSDEKAKVSDEVRTYVQAMERGANDKSRRFDRQSALIKTIEGCFAAKRGK
ncbi:MAG: DUF262 domain-containing protein [Planctomycetes bacterium]|nr:DUF262 domain-containing protein [Planctomycetota bacterium]